jgi:ATP-dependent Clp protease protease subunit
MFKGLGKILGIDPSQNNYFLLMGEVCDESCHAVIDWIMSMNLSPKDQQPEHLTLFVCSPGGDLHAAFALIDIMRGSPIPVATVGLGGIASAATLIVMSGAKGKRILTPNTSVMSHQYTSGAFGKHHELIAVQKEHQLTSDRLVKHYAKCTGLKENKIKTDLLSPSDTWMTAEEALDYGIVDLIKELK